MQNFSAIRPAVRLPFQKNWWGGVASPPPVRARVNYLPFSDQTDFKPPSFSWILFLYLSTSDCLRCHSNSASLSILYAWASILTGLTFTSAFQDCRWLPLGDSELLGVSLVYLDVFECLWVSGLRSGRFFSNCDFDADLRISNPTPTPRRFRTGKTCPIPKYRAHFGCAIPKWCRLFSCFLFWLYPKGYNNIDVWYNNEQRS